MTDPAPSAVPRLRLRRAALAAGFCDDEIARLRRRGDWTTLQRGAYLEGAPVLGARTRHVLALRATLAGLRSPATVSHASAAALHGLPLWGVPLAHVHVTRSPPAPSTRRTRLHAHAASLDDDDVVTLGGDMVVTSVARTVVDLARCLPFAPALVVADAALHDRLTTSLALTSCLARAGGRPGARAAARVVSAADGRSESVGESRSRALMHQLGMPLPELQWEVRTPAGRLVGRSDFGWAEARLLGEFDGRVKYGRLLEPGQEPGDAVFEEKRREDALRDERYRVVRWVWRDLDAPATFRARILRGLSRAGS